MAVLHRHTLIRFCWLQSTLGSSELGLQRLGRQPAQDGTDVRLLRSHLRPSNHSRSRRLVCHSRSGRGGGHRSGRNEGEGRHRPDVRADAGVLSDKTRALLRIRDGMVQLIHWGPAELEGGVIDPSRFGSNRHTMSDLRARGDRFAMFYVRDEDAEGVVMGCGGGDGGRKVRYEAELPAADIYEFNTDPLGLFEEAEGRYREDWGGVSVFGPNQQAEYIGAAALGLGFKAMIVDWTDSRRVDAFVPVRPTACSIPEAESEISPRNCLPPGAEPRALCALRALLAVTCAVESMALLGAYHFAKQLADVPETDSRHRQED
mmetsp:Transcript_20174/g.50821  ORF Transcript_20174/g.50821 Transcript_20174/m.50821 type:complete len:318 (-) Transcript_20174:107-1060(-)|eukprot:jgi/Tetstr1/427143/TSEL_017332.t1